MPMLHCPVSPGRPMERRQDLYHASCIMQRALFKNYNVHLHGCSPGKKGLTALKREHDLAHCGVSCDSL